MVNCKECIHFEVCAYVSHYLQTCDSYEEPDRDMLNKLAHYEDLDEAGRLVELPCAVGDTVYSFSSKKVYPFTVNGFHINKYDVEFMASYCGDEKSFENWTIRFSVLKFGKTVFLTREAAEQALDGKEGEQE